MYTPIVLCDSRSVIEPTENPGIRTTFHDIATTDISSSAVRVALADSMHAQLLAEGLHPKVLAFIKQRGMYASRL